MTNFNKLKKKKKKKKHRAHVVFNELVLICISLFMKVIE